MSGVRLIFEDEFIRTPDKVKLGIIFCYPILCNDLILSGVQTVPECIHRLIHGIYRHDVLTLHGSAL